MNVRFKNSVFLYVSLLLVILILFGAFSNQIVIQCINTFTGYTVQYDKLRGNLLLKTKIKDLTLSGKNNGLTVKAGESVIDFLPGKSLRKRSVILKCDFNNVTFSVDKSLKHPSNAGAILAMPFNSGWKYEKVAFLLDAGLNNFKVSGFEAFGKKVRMKGFYHGTSSEITLDLKLAFSPDTTEEYLGEYKDFLFSPDKEGWYTVKITVRGNHDNPQIFIRSDLFRMNIHSE